MRVTNFLLAFQGAHSTEEQKKDQHKPQPVVSSQQLQERYQQEKQEILKQQQDEMDNMSREVGAELKLKKAKSLLKKEKEKINKLEEEKSQLTASLKEVETKNKFLEKEMIAHKQETEKKLQKIMSTEMTKISITSTPSHAIRWSELDIKRRISGGGFAEIFEAEYHGEVVAVKKFLEKEPGRAKKEMETEVSILSSLHSGHVIQLLGFCSEPPCIIMEVGILCFFFLVKRSNTDTNTTPAPARLAPAPDKRAKEQRSKGAKEQRSKGAKEQRKHKTQTSTYLIHNYLF
eukprot:TRINITY_DN2186_c0_g1_i1.p1 TRINITY_DN2186_c0_g1~~TRINITY_DN2186_c0_g1_i1.p1  ORF type:complete len:289 (+),score=108.32 TRINITY_DN2186_c0_g1_i1:319-1185(+)